MRQYSYDGPVLLFGKCIAKRWQATTCATSENKARNNLAYRFKQENGKVPTVKITLPGKIVAI